ncbi:MAG: guanine deaminase [Roseitalea sp.]|nr:guanine deaminase [Roseitalea sp.]MBO6950426.1 guanine deaminase [Rhizobiaceae bacterium]MBO6591585.1 guanine deaminase [Roseitalea sp.]MBO6599440.1 guanine deaminase [Roseitalea sp.]MBO6612071.1 guanine deaminase [Roseitalea sp.]
MTDRLLRGRLLTFHRAPADQNDTDAFTYHEDGAILVREGMIAASGTFDAVAPTAPCADIVDHRPHLMTAGFIDAHIHFPQAQIVASWGAQLLDWLNGYVFPEEARFGDESHAQAIATRFFDVLTEQGTTTAAAFCSVHAASADAYFAEAERRNMRMIGGKVMMDRNAPDTLRDTPQSGYDDTKALIERWHGRGRAGYAISPRFAITSSPQQLEMAGALATEHPDCHIQTHLSENREEIAFAASLYPEASDYLNIYERYGLLGGKMLLGHCIHLEEREVQCLAETGAHPVFCPTSNLFLGSGCFDHARLDKAGIQSAIATDIGAGTSYSMLQTLNEGYKVLQLQSQSLHAMRGFHWMTRGNAEVLGLADRIGTLDEGTEADIVVLDARATPAMALRMDRVETLAEELFVLLVMGDDRAVAQTYIAGEPHKETRR